MSAGLALRRLYLAAGGSAALIRQIEALRTRDTVEAAHELPHLDIPTGVTWRVDDQFQEVGYGERFSRDSNAPLRRVEGGKHFTPENYCGVIEEEIAALAGTLDAQSSTGPA